ncbi:MAG: AMP-binding protein, partial [Nocardioides sp.]|nr:AMP-binding protein [Nocardioides sp.]
DAIVGINPTRRGVELAHDVRHADCDILITEPMYLDEVANPEFPLPTALVHDVTTPAYADWLEPHRGADLPAQLPDPENTMLLLFSSGSTGAPKAVICTQGRLGRLTASMVDRVSLHRDSLTYMCLPLFHGHAIMMNLCTAASVGATVVMARKFSASRFVADVREHDVTYFNYVGRVLSYVLATPADPGDRDNRLEVAFGSEASPAEVAAFRERFGCEVREGYGASEGMIRIVPVDGAPVNSLGLPANNVVAQIRSDDNQECPPAVFDTEGRLVNAEEATGEIVVMGRGPMFEGYYRNEEAMADRLKFGGENFWTGDLGYRDTDGYFYFAGRSSDWLRVDGENFATAPVERILVRYPQFGGAHAYAVPDPKTGDQLMCAVTINPGETFDPAKFREFLDAQTDLGTKWRPRFVRVVEAVPTTANGKINKAPLRATAWEATDVWWTLPRSTEYVAMSDVDKSGIREEFRSAGRENALPAASLVAQR